MGQNARAPILHGWRFGHPFLFCLGSLRTWVAFFHSYQHILIPRKDMRNFAPIPYINRDSLIFLPSLLRLPVSKDKRTSSPRSFSGHFPALVGNISGTGKQRLKIEVFIGELTPKKIQVAKTSGTLISPFSSSLLVTSVKIRPTSFRKYS